MHSTSAGTKANSSITGCCILAITGQKSLIASASTFVTIVVIARSSQILLAPSKQ